MDVSIVVVTYNSGGWVDRCLDSIARGMTQYEYEVIVVDNGSSDGSAEILGRWHTDARLVLNDANVGFARAVNQGVALGVGEWILLVNPDTEILEESLDHLMSFALSHPGHGLYGGRTLSEDGTLDPSSCWGLPSLWSLTCFATGLSSVFRNSRIFDPESLGHWQRDSVREVGIVTGCLLLARRDDWDSWRGFDEQYYVYGEDADLAARVRSLGMRPIITPKAVIIHALGASSNVADKRCLLMAGKATYVTKHFGAEGRRIGLVLLRSGVFLRAALTRLHGRNGGWQEAWLRRREWWNGYPAGQDTPSPA